MIVVADANRIFSALVRDGETRRALFTTSRVVCAPGFLADEVRKHQSRLVRISGLQGGEFDRLLGLVLDQVAWVSDEIVAEQMERASKALARVDPKDVPYLACALAIGADAIWSFDTDFDAQKLVKRIPHLETKVD